MTDAPSPTSGQSSPSRPWVRWVAIGCSGLLLLGVLFVVAIGWLVIKGTKSSGAYHQALAGVRASPGVKAALGEPIEDGWWVTGSINVSGTSGEAEISFPVFGPSGKATVYAEGRKQAGEWDLHFLEVEFKKGAERIDVLSEQEENSLEVVESFLALVAQGDYEGAHDLFSRPLKQAQPYETFEAVVRNNAGLFQAKEIRLKKSAGEAGPSYRGTLFVESVSGEMRAGAEVPASFDLVREGGRWRLIGYNIGS